MAIRLPAPKAGPEIEAPPKRDPMEDVVRILASQNAAMVAQAARAADEPKGLTPSEWSVTFTRGDRGITGAKVSVTKWQPEKG